MTDVEEIPPVAVGDVLADKYEVERVLGIGGMGAVVAARHRDLGELRALKFMLPSVSANQEAAKRFLREARAVARLSSEYVARIHDTGRLEHGEPYLVMEYLEGEDLRQLLKKQPKLPIEDAVDYAMQALAGLAEAHAAGIVHRDLKPPNLFITTANDGLPRVKILDFGVSKVSEMVGVDIDRTKTNAMLGSPHYMSPEQMECTRDVDARSDIWSIGVLLYEMLGGDVPFDAPSITAITIMVVQREPERLASLRPDMPEELEAVVLRCLEKKPEDRYESVVDLAQELSEFASPRTKRLAEHIARVRVASDRSGSFEAQPVGALELDRDVDGDEEPPPEEPAADDERPGEHSHPSIPTKVATGSRIKQPAIKEPGVDDAREARSKTAATWSESPPPVDKKRSPLLLVIAGAVVGAVVVTLLSSMGADESEPAPTSEPAVTAAETASEPASDETAEPEPTEEPAVAAPAVSATASASASASASAKPKKKSRRRRRAKPDIYDEMGRSNPANDKFYEDVDRKRRQAPDPYDE